MRNFVLAAVFVASGSIANAASLQIDEMPTVGIDGSTTFTLSLVVEEGEVFRGVDAKFNGEMNQQNPFGLASVFTDANAAIGGTADVSADSQFLFASTQVLSIGAEESATSLVAALSGLPSFAESVIPFAQISTSATFENPVAYDLSFDIGAPEPFNIQGVIPIPEPTTVLLAGLALVGVVARRS